MIRPKSVRRGVLRLALSLLCVASMAGAAHAATKLENMHAAFNGESNAHARYVAFAAQADKERYGEVASLFRAAARAEEIHASNHAAVINELGTAPNAKIDTSDVKSTRDNLEAAIKGET
jgi:rubrerythrin